MKLMLVNDSGVVVGEIEDIEEYDLTKPMARSELCDEIKQLLDDARESS